MNLEARNLGRKFNRQWIFRNLDLNIAQGARVAITGANGSGKSTLLQILAGMMPQTEGSIDWKVEEKSIDEQAVFQHLVFSAPYQLLPEYLSPIEILKDWYNIKKLSDGFQIAQLLEEAGLASAAQRPVQQFSSGMKQRLKLLLCLYADCPLILLDEPTGNLDQSGTEWVLKRLNHISQKSTLIIASNLPEEVQICNQLIQLKD